jgi:hypothetical protein
MRYPGSGQATLLNANYQVFLIGGSGPQATTPERIGTGTPNYSSIAVQLERQKSASYPFGFAIEGNFNAAPGSFEIDIQASESDVDASYIVIGSITAINSNNYFRFDGVPSVAYPRFVRLNVVSLTNDVSLTARITR